jgi:divalent metal cation (Fe/Co/Zn/Cd) transporter
MTLEAITAGIDITICFLAIFVARKVHEPASIALGHIGTVQASAYVDPIVCIALSVIFLRKPYEILRDSVGDLVDVNPYADTVNAIEESARALAERFYPEGLEWVRVRKAGRRVFVMVSFFVDPGESLEGMDIARQDVTQEMASLHPDVEMAVLFRSAPAK